MTDKAQHTSLAMHPRNGGPFPDIFKEAYEKGMMAAKAMDKKAAQELAVGLATFKSLEGLVGKEAVSLATDVANGVINRGGHNR